MVTKRFRSCFGIRKLAPSFIAASNSLLSADMPLETAAALNVG
jgi:hypothetical protein